MAIFGNDCIGTTFNLYDGSELIGSYSKPVEITETYLGEPYLNFVPIDVRGETGYRCHLMRGDGIVIATAATFRTQFNITFVPPNRESDSWALLFPDVEIDANYTWTKWYSYYPPSNPWKVKIIRYKYTNPVILN